MNGAVTTLNSNADTHFPTEAQNDLLVISPGNRRGAVRHSNFRRFIYTLNPVVFRISISNSGGLVTDQLPGCFESDGSNTFRTDASPIIDIRLKHSDGGRREMAVSGAEP